MVTRASGAPLRRSRSSERGHGKSATDNAPRQQTHRSTGPTARPASGISDAGGVRGGSLSAAGGAAGAAAGADSPRGAPRGDVSASSVGLVDAPETESETKSTSPREPGSPKKGRRVIGKNFIRKYRTRGGGALDGSRVETTRRDDTRSDPSSGTTSVDHAQIDRRVDESLERLLETEDDAAFFDGSSEEAFSALDRSSLSSTLERRTRRDATRRLDAAAARFAALHPGAPTADKDVDAQEVRCVELAEGDAVVRVGVDGGVSLFRRRKDAAAAETRETRDSGRGAESRKSAADGDLVLVSAAFLGLPPECADKLGEVTRVSFDRRGDACSAEITWRDGDADAPTATLVVESASCGAKCDVVSERRASALGARWNAGLEHGFVLDFSVFLNKVADPEHASAEIAVDLAVSGDWFGGGHLMRQHWPLNSGCWEVGPHYPFDNGPNGVNTLVSTHWVSSAGAAVLCDPDTPYLHVGLNAPVSNMWDNLGGSNRAFGVGIQNATRHVLPMDCTRHDPDGSGREGDGHLRLQARSRFAKGKGAFQMDHPMIGWESSFDSYDEDFDTYDFSGSFDDDACVEPHVEKSLARSKMKHSEVANRCLSMRVALCALPDVRRATETCLATLPRPAAPPPPEVIRAPIWTTWARYKQNVDQRKTLTFAREILANELPASVMEIDDKWQAGYGELDFDLTKFPDPKGMVDELHALGFAVTLWVMPFVEEDTEAFREGSELGYFVTSKRRTGNLKPGFFKWWNAPPVVALDVTNPEAVDWFVTRLKRLQTRYGIDGFKFDAGEPCFLPRMFETREALGHPSEYTRYWVERVASRFALAEVRTGHGTTGVGVLTRMGDRFSEWGSGNGLRSIIPTLLTSGVMGYPFCLPDMIGGNAYFGRRPDRELLVRWAQANALMPAMQFSIAPWDAGADVADLIRSSLKVRARIVDYMIRLTGEACDDLAPMCRPMWWLDPLDEKTHRIADQFAVGDDVIVAPVVARGAVTRDVYLTKGSWVDISDDPDKKLGDAAMKVHRGGAWLFGYDAPLAKLPCFLRVDDE